MAESDDKSLYFMRHAKPVPQAWFFIGFVSLVTRAPDVFTVRMNLVGNLQSEPATDAFSANPETEMGSARRWRACSGGDPGLSLHTNFEIPDAEMVQLQCRRLLRSRTGALRRRPRSGGGGSWKETI